MSRPALFIVSVSESFVSLWRDLGDELGMHVTLAQAGQSVDEIPAAVVVTAAGEEAAGIDVVGRYASSRYPVYLVGAERHHRVAVEALRRGAADYFALPAELDLLRRTLGARADAMRERTVGPRSPEGDPFSEILGENDAIREVLDRARRILPHRDLTVLLAGDTGTGKELLAQGLHRGSPRGEAPFVAINCAAIPASLLESELFGHVRGAFTDAHATKTGLIEEANGGTLFLDEIGHLPLPLQGKLLRMLEERTIRRVGANENRRVDVRIVAATHVNLERAAEAGEFREDLFYRLNVVTLRLPPLRDRGEDILLLAEHFMGTLAGRYGLPVPPMTAALRSTLQHHTWPGNVRELRHAIERALLLSPPGEVDPAELAVHGPAPAPVVRSPIPFPATLRDVETATARAALALHDGNKSAAARALGISRTRLQRLLDAGNAS